MTTLKVNVIRKPTIKVKVLPNFPSSVTASSPIILNRTGGNYAFSLDPTALASSLIIDAGNITSGTLAAARLPAFTGDITTPLGSSVTTLATVNANVGTFGSATQVSQFGVNAKGLVTSAVNVTITPVIGSITGLGTGVATALGVNVGTAGSIVVNGGALGTPSSGTLTSATGLPISTGITGTGTGVLAALAVNVGSAGAFVTFNGALGSPSSVGTLPDHTLGGTISGGGNQINNVIIGTTTPLAASFTTVNKVTITAPATAATLTLINGTTLTGPAASGTVMTLGNNETVTGVKTFGAAGNVGKLAVAGTTSGSTVVNATAVASGTLTLPAATDTLIGKATTDILTNKTFNSTATGNVLQVSGVTVSSGQYPGEPTTGNATAGNVGEYIESVIPSGSAVTVINSTGKTITSISLPAGDWDVNGTITLIPGATTNFTVISGSLSLVTNTTDNTPGRFNQFATGGTVNGGNLFTLALPPYRFSLSGTTTIFLTTADVFTVSTMTAYGIIRARRVR